MLFYNLEALSCFSKTPLTLSKEKFKEYKKNLDSNLSKSNIDTNPNDNNSLIISEIDQKAYLPFRYNDINEIFQNSKDKYLTLKDVIEDIYILPLSRFKYSSFSRFRESFHLIIDKEKGSFFKALDLAIELMFKYELNPIIIAACKNLDELDIYLDCLEENELSKFTCFNIDFKIAPQLFKTSKNFFKTIKIYKPQE